VKKEKPKLTDRQEEVLAFIKHFMKHNKRPPSREDINDHFGFSSKNASQDHLKALHKKGRIKLIPYIARGIEIL
jgi:repressor LexA